MVSKSKNIKPEEKKKIVEDIDHAFELALILITLITGILSQYVPTTTEQNLPPIIANLQRMSIIFIFPLLLAIVVWVSCYFSRDENRKMLFRTFAWTSVIINAILGFVEFYLFAFYKISPEWVSWAIGVPSLLFSLIIPVIPVLLVHKIQENYRLALGELPFFRSLDFFRHRWRNVPILHDSLARLNWLFNRYGAFLISYGVFWIAFYLTILS